MQYTLIINSRNSAIEVFQNLRLRATLIDWVSWVFGKNTRLVPFYEKVSRPPTNFTYIGLRDIPVRKIVGSLGREKDFDASFRPLKAHLRDRWVSIYLLFEKGEVPPIKVYKVDDVYYVEDGHHRVSVANSRDMAFIQAEIWEYPPLGGKPAAVVQALPICAGTAVRRRRSALAKS